MRVPIVSPLSGPVKAPARLSVSQWTQLNWSRVKLLRYQLTPAVAAQPRPPVSRLV